MTAKSYYLETNYEKVVEHLENMNKNFAIFSDIDGTLVSFKTHRIPDSAVEALTDAKQRGHHFYISTGRPPQFINNLQQIEHLIDGYLTTNGAYCYIGQEVVSCQYISKEDLEAIVEASNEMNFCLVIAGDRDIVVHNSNRLVYEIYQEGLNVPMDTYSQDLQLLNDQHILQISPFITVEEEKKVMPRLKHCMSNRWHPQFTDITAAGVDKAMGFQAMIKHLGIDPSCTVALGDGGNDAPLLRAAGIGVAMGNADESTQQSADYVTAHVDDDGFAKALRHFGLAE